MRLIRRILLMPAVAALTMFAGSGRCASLGWFVAYEVLGNRQAQLYGGGLREWAADPNNPMARAISVD